MVATVGSLAITVYGDTTNVGKALTAMGTDVTALERKTNASLTRMDTNFSAKFASIGRVAKAGFAGLAAGMTIAGADMLVSKLADINRAVAGVGDSAKRAGLDFKSFQELAFVAKQNRIEVDALTDGIKELNLRADEFIATGKGSSAEAFGRLGYNATELAEKLKDPSALFSEIIGKLGQFNKASQIRIMDELFGGTGGEKFVQLIALGEEGIRGQIAAAHDLNAVLRDDVIKQAGEIDKRFTEISTSISGWIQPRVIAFLGDVLHLLDLMKNPTDQMDSTLDDKLASIGKRRLDIENQILRLQNEQREAAKSYNPFGGVDNDQAIKDLKEENDALAEQEKTILKVVTAREKAAATPTAPAELPDNSADYIKEYREQLALTSRERAVATETERILADAKSRGKRVTDEAAAALAEEKIARDDAEKAASKKQRTDDQSGTALQNLITSTQAHIDAVKAEAAALGMTGEEAEVLRVEQELLNEAIARGVEITPELSAKFHALAQDAAQVGQAYAAAKLEADLLFERQQMFRSDTDQRIYDELRRANIDIGSAAGQRLAAEIGINEQVAKQREQYDDVRDTLTGMVDLLYQSGDIGEKLIDIFAQLGKQFAKIGAEKLFDFATGKTSSLFGNLPSVGGGGVSVVNAKASGTAMGQVIAPPIVASLNSGLDTYAAAIRKIESGSYAGNYNAVGRVVEKGMYAGDRAYGAYQVMGKNIESWTKQALGYSMTQQQFLNDRAAQDKVFYTRASQAFDKFGNWIDTGSVWFTGGPVSSTKGNPGDGKTSVPGYLSKLQSNMDNYNPSVLKKGVAAGVEAGIVKTSQKGLQQNQFDTTGPGSVAGMTRMQGGVGTIGAALGAFAGGYIFEGEPV